MPFLIDLMSLTCMSVRTQNRHTHPNECRVAPGIGLEILVDTHINRGRRLNGTDEPGKFIG